MKHISFYIASALADALVAADVEDWRGEEQEGLMEGGESEDDESFFLEPVVVH